MSSGAMATNTKEKDPSILTHELLAVVDEGDMSGVKRLLNTPGTSINGTNKHGESPLHIAAGYGRLNIVKLLHSSGASIDKRDKQGDTPLYWAARHGHLDVVQYLCEEDTAINAKDAAGETALHVTARYGYPDVLTLLCQSGAKLDVRDNDGDTPLLCACWHGYQNVVECLTQAGCSLQAANNEGETALHVAAVRGYYSIVRFLCENGAQLDSTDNNGSSAVQLATRRNHLDIVQYLCESGCNVNVQDNNGDTALHEACREGQLSLFHALFAAKCNLNLPNKNGATPLHLAAKYGHSELVRCLCTVGCDMNAVTEHGFTADEVAANSGHDNLATLVHHLRQDNLRDHYVSELALGQVPLHRAKLLVCGAAGVGKTELINSLKCNLLRSLFRRRSTSNLTHMILKRTHGINVQPVTIPNAGDFSVWDFSGMKEYYVAHEHFLATKNSVILIVFSLREPLHKQLAQVHFWLAMIKSRQAPSEVIRFAGQSIRKPFVVLVGSFLDQQLPPSLQEQSSDVFAVPLASNIQQDPDNGMSVLKRMVEEFRDYFVFADIVFTLDCRLSQAREMRNLRNLLGSLRLQVLKNQPWVPSLVQTLSQILPQWRRDHAGLPVLTWANFHSKVVESINPLASEEKTKVVASALHDTGEVVYISEGPLQNIVILDPAWLGMRIFGPALSPENSIFPQLKSVTGRVTFSEIQRIYPEWDVHSIANLLEHFELCIPREVGRSMYEFPCLIKMQPLFGLWEKDPSLTVYAGVHIKCRAPSDVFSPGLFPNLQIQVRKTFSDDIEDQEVTLWSDGLKCCRGDVEVQIQHQEHSRTIEILVRGTEETRPECYALLQQFYSLVIKTIRATNPGTNTATHILSARQLKEHKKDPVAYSAVEIFEAERSDGIVRDSKSSQEEHILDLVCCGCEDLVITAKSAPYALLRDVPLQTKVQLCRMLDPPESFGRDWCLLALQLGLTEEVPVIDQANDNISPTEKLLASWEKGVSTTLVAVVDALRGIGREDAAQVLVEGLSLFMNATSSVVVNVPGVAVTSYVC